MTNKEFLDFVLSCRIDRLDSKLYLATGLGGESGEVLNQVKKEYRSEVVGPYESRRTQVLDESGDTLHYLVSLNERYGITLEEIMDFNVAKLTARYGGTFPNQPNTPEPSKQRLDKQVQGQ